MNITLGILAGGLGTRMGGVDKGLIPLNNRPIIEHIIERLPYPALISANRNHELYASYGFPVLADEYDELPGPLNGIATLISQTQTEHLLIVPCDCFPPTDLLAQLGEAQSKPAIVVGDGERAQHCCCLLNTGMRDNLLADLLSDPPRSVRAWLKRIDATTIHVRDWPAHYWNINTAEDLARIEHETAIR